MRIAATSAPLADDGFREWFSLDRDRRIVRIVVVDIQGGVGERGNEADAEQVAD